MSYVAKTRLMALLLTFMLAVIFLLLFMITGTRRPHIDAAREFTEPQTTPYIYTYLYDDPTPSPMPSLEPSPEPFYYEEYEEYDDYEEYYEPLIPRWSEGEAFLLDHLLCDFDYLMFTLRHNFPLFGPAYRRFGLDVNALEAQTRQAIIDSNTTDPQTFSNILAYRFFRHFGGFGHLYQNWYNRIHLIMANIYRYSTDDEGNILYQYSQLMHDIFTSPEARRFYGEIIVDLGAYEHGMIIPNNVQTRIITPGEVAYVSIRQFNHYNIPHDQEIIHAFFEDIAGFSHLIVDLRYNPGGFMSYFYEIFVEPNIIEPLEWREFEFFPRARNNMIYATAFVADWASFGEYDSQLDIYGDFAAEPITIENAAGVITRYNMRYFNQDDLEMLDNVVVWRHQILPASNERMFDGKIWVLVGPRSQSATEAVSIFIRETGFATLVGEPTGGIMGGMSAYVLLPNSGIVVRYDLGLMTDPNGRSYEEFGVQPHYFNRAGMDALDTVLALIREGY